MQVAAQTVLDYTQQCWGKSGVSARNDVQGISGAVRRQSELPWQWDSESPLTSESNQAKRSNASVCSYSRCFEEKASKKIPYFAAFVA
jgi:hypothetical protein